MPKAASSSLQVPILGSSGSNGKLDVASLPASANSNASATANHEQEKASRDSLYGSNKERVVLKLNKFNVRDNNCMGGMYTMTKGKASRAPRTVPLIAGNSSTVSRSSETLQAWEQPSNVNKPHSVNGTSNRKRPLPTGSPSSPMAQWVGQRPQKISRTRRVNVVSPVMNCDEVQMSLEGCSPSDIGTRIISIATSGSHLSKGAVNSIQHGSRVEHENVSSPARLSESEDSGAGENGESKLKEKKLGSNEVDGRAINNSYNINSSMLETKKNKMVKKEEIGDGPRRQGRSSRGSSILKTSPMKEKLAITTLTKPIRNMKPASEKNGSKSGRPPLKKSCDRKAITRLGHPSTGNSPDIAGESDDDREELLAAANFACNASFIGCSSSFWKKVGPIFVPVSLEDIAYLEQLVKSTEEDDGCLSQLLGRESDTLDGLAHMDNLSQSPLSREREGSILNQTDSKEISSMVDMVDQHLDISLLCRQMDSKGNKVAPLYQRVLTALIIDDETDEDTVGDGIMSLICERDDPPAVACFSQDVEHQSRFRSEYESKSDMISCNGTATFTTDTGIHDQELDDPLHMHLGPSHPETEMLLILSENGNGGLLATHRISSCSSSLHCHFEQMSLEDKLLLELQSVGLYPEPVPGLADGDKEAINQDIIHLQKGLHQQVTRKREYLMKLIQPVEEGREMEQRALEQVAMDKLVELAYKKKLATRGSSAARNGLPKVSKQVALAFMRRTLARCRQFEETGKSCFLEPVLKDVLFTAPARDKYAGSIVNLPQTQNSQQESALSGLFPCGEQDVSGNLNRPSDQDFARTGPIQNRGKKKELLVDDVGASASLRSASSLGNFFMGGAKGKRSERERDKDASGRNSGTKGGRHSAGHSRGERKTKAKPKQKAVQLSTSGNGSLSKLVEITNSEHQLATGSNEVISGGSNRKTKVGAVSHPSNTKDLSFEAEAPMDLTNLHELDSIELGVGNELNGHQDLESWLNIDEDGLQEHDAEGLYIPMDDLSDLNMLL